MLPGIGQSSWVDEIVTISPPLRLRHELLRRELGAEERALEVYRQHLVEVGFAGLEQRRAGFDTRVADQDVEPAEVLDGGLDDPVQVFGARDVCFHSDRAAARPSGSGYDLGCVVRVHAVVDDDVRAFRGGGEHDRLADAAIAASHDDGLAFEHHASLYPDRCQTGWSDEPAVGVDDLTVDPAPGRPDQERHDAGDVLGTAETAERRRGG